ncbi:hypothetical protein F4861DRAFT_463769 [Xylaria intraflava]|nr:hypothetical protein F4861DRAFT_463769 [Xylaria intraflava]
MSASRQKNCNGCVQTKRRCDRRTPVCSRCVERGTLCVYNKSKEASRQDKNAVGPSPSPWTPSYPPFNTTGSLFDVGFLEGTPTDLQPEIGVDSIHQSGLDAVVSGDISMPTSMDFLPNVNSPCPDQWFIHNSEMAQLTERPSPNGGEVAGGFEKMAFCARFGPWNLYDPTTSLFYIVNRVKEFSAEIAARNTTPFLHRRLYHDYMPQCILSVFSTCVLYASRTPENTAMVIKALSHNARELVDNESRRVTLPPVEKLARAQALFLYQMIRLFDGDVTLRAQGERDIALLKKWLGELCHIRDNLGDLVLLEQASIREQPPIEWEKWIFAECVRRTVLVAYAALNLYELLKDPTYREIDSPWNYAHRWTLGRSLWEATSTSEFSRAWKESSHSVIVNFSLGNFAEKGIEPGEIDGFAEMILKLHTIE